jgi:NitT/TauT family transport system permease protein
VTAVAPQALPLWKRWIAQAWLPVAFVFAFFALWEGGIHLFHIERYILPAPSKIFVQFVNNFSRIAWYTLVTGGEALAGFLVAIALGVPLALVIAFSSTLRRTLYPGAVTLEMVPKIAFAPVFVTWFGFGVQPKIFIVFLVCFFPILLNGILAFTSLSEDLGRLCRSTGASRRPCRSSSSASRAPR